EPRLSGGHASGPGARERVAFGCRIGFSRLFPRKNHKGDLRKMKKHRVLLPLLLAVFVLFGGCASLAEPGSAPAAAVALEDVPAFSDAPYVEIDGNQPAFSEAERTAESFETYSALDELGRCGPAFACIGQDLMPTQERESISQVRPTGWQNAEYDFVDGGYLYNRCHLIGFQLTGENANERNL